MNKFASKRISEGREHLKELKEKSQGGTGQAGVVVLHVGLEVWHHTATVQVFPPLSCHTPSVPFQHVTLETCCSAVLLLGTASLRGTSSYPVLPSPPSASSPRFTVKSNLIGALLKRQTAGPSAVSRDLLETCISFSLNKLSMLLSCFYSCII